jgi:serine/threonine protein phosphatase 1
MPVPARRRRRHSPRVIWKHEAGQPQPSTGGRLVYAIGDVHGCSDALAALLRQVEADARRSAPDERALLVFLGDYVDRGPDSRGVIDRILGLQATGAFEVVTLKGNHEDALARYLDDAGFARAWAVNWGEETLRSYGVEPPRTEADWAATQRAFVAAFPSTHRAFLRDLKLMVSVGDYLFVHAGVRPHVALGDQDANDLIWIRYEFLECENDFGKVVVHGHTPALEPELRHNRIGVDTGVYFSGVLTAVRLHGTERRFLQARA